MATIYEYYNTGDNANIAPYGTTWYGQTFTPSVDHKITSVKLLLSRIGSPGTVTVSIRATDGSGHPTGSDLCSGTTNGDTLPDTVPGEWREVTLGDGADLSASTKYAIIVRALDGDNDNKPRWRLDSTSPTYTGGCIEQSSDSGSSWTSYPNYDFMFEEWGEPLVTEKTSSDAGSGVDAYVSLETSQAKTSSDTGSGADAKESGNPAATLIKTETGSGSETLFTRLLAAFDTGYGAEMSSVVTDGQLKNLFAAELGQGSDSLTAKIEMPTKGGGMKLWT